MKPGIVALIIVGILIVALLALGGAGALSGSPGGAFGFTGGAGGGSFGGTDVNPDNASSGGTSADSPSSPTVQSGAPRAQSVVTIPLGYKGQGYYTEPDGTRVPTGSLSQSGALATTAPGSQFAHVGKPGAQGSGWMVGDITPDIPVWQPRPSSRADAPEPPQVRHAGRTVDYDLRGGLPAPQTSRSSEMNVLGGQQPRHHCGGAADCAGKGGYTPQTAGALTSPTPYVQRPATIREPHGPPAPIAPPRSAVAGPSIEPIPPPAPLPEERQGRGGRML